MEKAELGNPFTNRVLDSYTRAGEGTMTACGTAWKGLFLLGILVVVGAYAWSMIAPYVEVNEVMNAKGHMVKQIASYGPNMWMIWVGSLCGLGVAIAIIRNERIAPYLAWLYAGLEGLAIGGLSAAYEKQFPGIVANAAFVSVAVLFAMLVLYGLRILRNSPGLMAFLLASMSAILVVYVSDIVLRMFGWQIPLLNDSSTAGIVVSVAICIVAALNFIPDFDIVTQGEENGAPKYMEWYAAFSVLVTLIWLYLEILRLLAKAKSRD